MDRPVKPKAQNPLEAIAHRLVSYSEQFEPQLAAEAKNITSALSRFSELETKVYASISAVREAERKKFEEKRQAEVAAKKAEFMRRQNILKQPTQPSLSPPRLTNFDMVSAVLDLKKSSQLRPRLPSSNVIKAGSKNVKISETNITRATLNNDDTNVG